jgi:histidyl-tRNA synthetase
MDAQIAELGVDAGNKKTIFRLIDRRDKMSAQAWEAYAIEQGLSTEQLSGLKLKLSDAELWKQSPELRRLFAVLDASGGLEYVDYDAGVIRGLEYYTGTVFEAFEATGEGRAILGGGRYDNLLADVGGDPLPGVGFAMGDVMISLILEKNKKFPDFSPFQSAVLVTVFDEGRLGSSYELAAALRSGGLQTLCYPEPAKLPKQLKFADRIGVRFVIICGPDEDAAGKATVKDLKTRSQVIINREEVVGVIKQFLAQELPV